MSAQHSAVDASLGGPDYGLESVRFCRSCRESKAEKHFYGQSQKQCIVCKKWWVRIRRAADLQDKLDAYKTWAKAADDLSKHELMVEFSYTPNPTSRKKKGRASREPFDFSPWF